LDTLPVDPGVEMKVGKTKYLVWLRLFNAASLVLAVASLFACQSASAQLSGHARSRESYHPNDVLNPEDLMSQERFGDSARRGYVVVEGYIDYVAGTIVDASSTTRVKTEADGDYHFEMQSTNSPRPGGESPNGLVCEIDPAWQLKNWNILSQIDRKKPATYRRVRVYGWLRFGTELGHSGTQPYNIGNGRIVKGHWEIHPVERVEAADNGKPFDIGPSARVASWPAAQRYKVTNANFGVAGPSNYARLSGRVIQTIPSSDKSGDVDVWINTGKRKYLATVPHYYVESFDAQRQTINFIHVSNFSTIGYSLTAGTGLTRVFYGLRNWKFRLGVAFPALQPVEMIK
jgi:hypothetical protein